MTESGSAVFSIRPIAETNRRETWRSMIAARILLTALCLALVWAPSASAIAVGDQAPSFQTVTLTGRSVSLEDVKNSKGAVMVFWATWCPLCDASIPSFKEFNSKYAHTGVIFLAINPGVNDSLKRVELYVKKNDLNYPVAYDDKSIVSRLFAIKGVPTVIVLDNKGTIRYVGAEVPKDIGSFLDQGTRQSEQGLRAARP